MWSKKVINREQETNIQPNDQSTTYRKCSRTNTQNKDIVLSAIIPCKVKEICTHTAFDPNPNKKQDNRL